MSVIEIKSAPRASASATPMVPNAYSLAAGQAGLSTAAGTNQVMFVYPWVFARACTLDRASIDISGAGEAGSTSRIVIYSDLAGLPGSLLLDTGTSGPAGAGDGTVTGANPFTISCPVSPWVVYWVGDLCQNATTTRPTRRTYQSSLGSYAPSSIPGGSPGGAGGTGAWRKNSVSGAPPASFGTPDSIGAPTSCAAIWLRAQ